MKHALALLSCSLLLTSAAFAIKTQSLTHTGFQSLRGGELENLSLTSQGILELGRELEELIALEEPVIWSGLVDPQGRLILGTGNHGVVYRIDPAAEEPTLETLFDPGDVLVRALAMDGKGTLYAGTSPDGKLYRIADGERPQIFFDPEETYIWDVLFDEAGNLFVATGPEGNLYKLPPDYAGEDVEPWASLPQRHITVLRWDNDGHLLAGTAPEATLYRFDAEGTPEVLYNAPADEVSGIHVQEDGTLLFSVFREEEGENKGMSPLDLPRILESFQRSTDDADPDASEPAKDNGEPQLPSFLYKMEPEGFVEPWWTPGANKIYSFLANGAEEILIGTDSDGEIYSVRGRNRWRLLQTVPNDGQVTDLIPAGNEAGDVFVLTSNPAAVYRLKGDAAAEGHYTSTVIDTKQVARWGSLRPISFDPMNPSTVEWQTRTGNSADTDENWSDWEAVTDGKIASPAARFLQYKGIWTEAGDGIRAARIFYMHQNFAPIINRVNIVPVQIQLINVPSSQKPNIDLSTLLEGANKVRSTAREVIYRRFRVLDGEGYMTAGWKAYDANGDSLVFDVEIRGDGEMRWVKLAEALDMPAFSFNTNGFEDGYYEVRVTASDALSNPPGDARTGFNLSEPFLIDNTAPEVELLGTEGDAAAFTLRLRCEDAFSIIHGAEYILNGADARMATPEDGLFDSQREELHILLHDLEPGTHSILVEVRDESGNAAVLKKVFEVPAAK